MKRIDFVQEVCDEINRIKKRATKKELAKLNFKTFDHNKPFVCIYGQMTGDCYNERARKLYKKTYKDIQIKGLNEKSFKFKELDFTPGNYFTALEKYLYICGKKVQKDIIDYLKGDKLELYLN